MPRATAAGEFGLSGTATVGSAGPRMQPPGPCPPHHPRPIRRPECRPKRPELPSPGGRNRPFPV